ncbi:MAG: hypothetical protein KBF28_03795 [Gemmatimonadales bacterium]|nr:hypothetical protein [Gemmatimonadales bacterium]
MHGTQEVIKAMREGGRAEACPLCHAPMRRLWTRRQAPLVQNHTVSEGGLVSFGHNERRERVLQSQWLAEERANRLEYGPQED